MGLLYADYRRSSPAVVYFPLMMVVRDLIGGLLVGIQEGKCRENSNAICLNTFNLYIEDTSAIYENILMLRQT